MITTILDIIIWSCAIALMSAIVLYVIDYIRIKHQKSQKYIGSNVLGTGLDSFAHLYKRDDHVIQIPILTLKHALDHHIIGNNQLKRGLIICLLSQGHLLIQGYPGTGKTQLTTLRHQLLGCSSSRIQGTSDLTPADLIGFQVYDRQTTQYLTRRGPLQHHIIVVDELNRMTPKAQSALLQYMQEHQLTIDQETLVIDQPSMLIATLNHNDLIGTYGVPDSLLDRFMLIVSSQVLDAQGQIDMLTKKSMSTEVSALTDAEEIRGRQTAVAQIPVGTHVSHMMIDIIGSTHTGNPSHRKINYLYTMSQARARCCGHPEVTDQDMQDMYRLMG